jgi:DNA polymerase (family 10)
VRRAVPGIEVLHGIEVDILADGALDLDDETLASLDWVVASLHSRLDQERSVITDRVLRALDHPAVHVMGHPTSRMIGTRAGAALDLERVFERAAANGVLMEINAQPDRLDLSDVNARLAREKGVSFVISTDAHSLPQLDAMRFGVFMARRAGLTKADVLNTLPFERFREVVATRRRSRGGAAAAPAARPAAAAPAARPAAPRTAPAAKAGRGSRGKTAPAKAPTRPRSPRGRARAS